MVFLKKNSKLVTSVLLAVFLLVGCGGADERKAKYMERGKAYFEENNFDKATVEFKNVIQIDPKSAEAYYYLGVISEAGRDWRAAYANYLKAVELNPDHVTARIHLAQFHLLSRDVEKAAEQIDAVLALEQGNNDALSLRASILIGEDREAEATEILQQILATTPAHLSAAAQLSALYERQGKPDEAIRVLENAVAADSDSIAFKLKLAKIYVGKNENDKAEGLLKAIVASNPDTFAHRVTLASYYSQTDQLDKAEKVMRDAIADAPEEVQRYSLLADFFRNKIGLDKAIAELNSAINARPDLTQLKFLLAEFYANADDEENSIATLRSVIDEMGVEPYGLAARSAIASIKFRQGKNEEGRVLVEEVLKENPKDNTALLLMGKSELQAKQYGDAIAAFRTILDDQPEAIEVHKLLANAHLANGEKALAIESIIKAINIDPKDPALRLGFAELLLKDGKLEDALEHIDAALAEKPDMADALRVKSELLAKLSRLDELEQVLTQLEKASPETGLGSFGKGRLYKAQNKLEEARAAFEDALLREPDSVLALTELVNTEISMGLHDDAIKRLETVLEKNAENKFAHVLLGMVYMEKEDYSRAADEFSAQLKVGEPSSVLYTQLGRARAMQGDLDAGIKVLQEGLQVLPDDGRLMYNLAGLYAEQGNLEKAIDLYKRGVEVKPDAVHFVLGLATIQQRQKKYEDAITVYEKYNRVNPNNAVIINNLAALLIDHRSDNKSLVRARELAIKLAKTDQAAFLDTLGWAHYRLGEYEEAVTVLSDVVNKAPNVPVFSYHLGMSYYKQGNLDKAKEILAGVVGDDKSYDGVQEARQIYSKLSSS